MKLKDKQQTKQIVHEHTQFLICLQPHFYKKKKKSNPIWAFDLNQLSMDQDIMKHVV